MKLWSFSVQILFSVSETNVLFLLFLLSTLVLCVLVSHGVACLHADGAN